MAYLLLYGNGWTQRWRVAAGTERHVRSEIAKVGTPATGELTVIDPGSDARVTLMVAWASVAAAVVLDADTGTGTEASAGQYA